MEKKYTPCGGCGETDPINRCIGCFHPFEAFNPDLLRVMQEAETTKEDDLKKVKEVISDGYPNTPEMDLILRIVANWGNAVEMPNMEQWLKEYAASQQCAVWVKANDFKYEVGTAYHAKDCNSKGAGAFNKDGAFIWRDGTLMWPKHREDLQILDESAGEKEEC